MNTQVDQARKALLYFHNRSLKYSGYKITFDELLNRLYKNKPQVGLPLLNNAIVISELSESEIKRLFENLADQGKGRIPSNANAFFDVLRGEVSNVTWSEIREALSQSASDISQGVMSGGEGIIDTLKSLNVILPIVIVGAVIYLIIQKTRQLEKS